MIVIMVGNAGGGTRTTDTTPTTLYITHSSTDDLTASQTPTSFEEIVPIPCYKEEDDYDLNCLKFYEREEIYEMILGLIALAFIHSTEQIKIILVAWIVKIIRQPKPKSNLKAKLYK